MTSAQHKAKIGTLRQHRIYILDVIDYDKRYCRDDRLDEWHTELARINHEIVHHMIHVFS